MTKEQKAIQQLKYLLFIYKDDLEDKYLPTGALFNKDFEAIETVLNMLKEKDKKLKMYKDIKEIANYKVTDLDKLKKLNEMQKEIEKKDKIIDYLLKAYLYSIASGEKFTLEINNKKYKDTEIDNRIEQLRKFVENNILKE